MSDIELHESVTVSDWRYVQENAWGGQKGGGWLGGSGKIEEQLQEKGINQGKKDWAERGRRQRWWMDEWESKASKQRGKGVGSVKL